MGGGQFGADEGVEAVWGWGDECWGGWEGLKGPVLAGAGHVEGGGDDGAGAWIGGPEAYPRFEGGDFFWGEFTADAVFERGHLEVFVGVANRLNEEALVGVAGDEGGAGGTAFEQGVTGVEREAAIRFPLGLAVALVTRLDENGADGGFEEFDLVGRESSGCCERGGRREGGDGGEEEGGESGEFLAAKRRQKSEGDG